jgi:hypothetical protein
MYLIETYSKACVSKHLSGMFPQGDDLSLMLFNFLLNMALGGFG